MAQQVLDYVISVGFYHGYGNDDGVAFGTAYDGTATELTAKYQCLGYAQGVGYPNATLSDNDAELAFNV